jgi:hypothetical protein
MIAFVRQVYKLLFVHIIEGEPFSFVDDVFPRGVPIETKDRWSLLREHVTFPIHQTKFSRKIPISRFRKL